MPPIEETTPAQTEGTVTADPVQVDPSLAVDVEKDPAPAADPASGDPADPAAPATSAAFTPNFKVKVMDKEHEIPERLRALITDADSQKEVEDLVTKALGFEHSKRNYPKMKEQLDRTQGEVLQERQKYARVEQGYNRLQKYLEKDDLQSFCEFWKIPEEKLLRHAAKLLRYQEMSESERAEVDRQRSTALAAESRGDEAAQYRTQAITAQANLREYQLDTALSRNDISDIAKQFDTRAGQPGAFKARIIRTAQMHAITAKKDISVDQAIAETMAELGFDLVDETSATPTASKPAAGAAAPAKIVASVQQRKLPVIPAGSAGGASPVKRTFRSVADLEKERDRLAGI